MADLYIDNAAKAVALQWGRNLTVADGRGALARVDRRALASMGPQPDGRGWAVTVADLYIDSAALQWGRNLTVADGHRGLRGTRRLASGFNGAAT